MSESLGTADFALSYQTIPRVNERFIMEPNSYVDVMLPSSANERSRLRLYDVNDRWIRAVDLSAYPYRIPEDDDLLEAHYGAFDTFELNEEIVVGREHNPDNLPILNKNVISRRHFSLAVSLGNRGIILAIKDINSHNGTEVLMNDTIVPYGMDNFADVA